MSHSFVVAVLHADETVRHSLAALLSEEGYSVVPAPLDRFVESPEDALSFLAVHDPQVIVFDVSPWDESARFLAFLAGAAEGRAFVLTTTAAAMLENVPLLREAIDLRSCPHAADELVRAVRRAEEASENARNAA